MLLAKIQTYLASYKKWLREVRHHPHTYKWESVQHFQTHWNLAAADPVVMFDRSFQNSETRRLWQSEHWHPKEMMLEFWRSSPQTLRLMFDDLFNENREVEGRIGRFLFGCDELLRDYRRDYPLSPENNHYHDDYCMIALYLAFRYPESYAPYKFPVFQQTLIQLGAHDIPTQHDLPRYFKVLKTLKNFLEKDQEALPALKKHLHPTRHFQGETLLFAEDFCRHISNEA